MYPNKDTFCLPGSLIGYLRYSFDSVCLSVKALTCFQGFVGIKEYIYIYNRCCRWKKTVDINVYNSASILSIYFGI